MLSRRRMLLMAASAAPAGWFVSIGGNVTTVLKSRNGTSWSNSASIGWGSYIYDVCYGSGKYVVVATDGNGAYRIYWTTDFSTWTQVTGWSSNIPPVVCHDGTYFVICTAEPGDVKKIYTSTDLSSLTLRRTQTTDTFVASAIGKNRSISMLVRGSGSSSQYIATLSFPYTAVNNYPNPASFGSYAPSKFHDAGNGRIFVFGRGYGHYGYIWSDDLINWSGVNSPSPEAYSMNVAFRYNSTYRCVKPHETRSIQFNSNPTTAYSTSNGNGFESISAITDATQTLVSSGGSGIWRSTDGVNFTQILSGNSQKIIYG